MRKMVLFAVTAIFMVGIVYCNLNDNPASTEADPAFFTVTFNTNGGSAVEPQQIAEGGTVNEPEPVPEKEHHAFAGWYKDNETFKDRWNFDENTVAGDITLFAKWVEYFTSIADAAAYLAAHQGGLSVNAPIFLPMDIDLGYMNGFGYANSDNGWTQLLQVIANADKYVSLDLSLCSLSSPIVFPNLALSAGARRVASLVLPLAATIISGSQTETIMWQNFAFRHFTVLHEVTGLNITSIGHGAFLRRTTLKKVNFPAVETIEGSAFNSTVIETANFPEASAIGQGAFGGTPLKSISFPSTVTIDGSVFANTPSLTSFILTDSGGDLSVIEGGKVLVRNGTELVAYPSASGSIAMDGITAIGTGAFSSNSILEGVSFPAVTTIGWEAFEGCTALESAYFPLIASIGDSAFARTGNKPLTITMGTYAPTMRPFIFTGVASEKTIIVRVPQGSVGYVLDGTTIPAFFSGADATVSWGNGFRGRGWNGTGFTGSSVNRNIALSIVYMD